MAAAIVEKPGGGPICNGNSISLRGTNGRCVDVENEAVQARWAVVGDWQSFVVELATEGAEPGGRYRSSEGGGEAAGSRVLMHGDVVCLRAHTGKLLRCPLRAFVGGAGESGGYAMPMVPVDAAALHHSEAQRFELLLC